MTMAARRCCIKKGSEDIVVENSEWYSNPHKLLTELQSSTTMWLWLSSVHMGFIALCKIEVCKKKSVVFSRCTGLVAIGISSSCVYVYLLFIVGWKCKERFFSG